MPPEIYDSFHEAPLEEQDPAEDGDDSIPVGARATGYEPRQLLTAPGPPTSLVVPYRYSEPGDKGDHVFALKRAHARYRGGGRLAMLMAKPKAVQRTWGTYTGPGSFTRDFKETQRRLGVTVTGTYNKATHQKLARWYDAYALALLQPDPRDQQIAKLIGWHMEFYNQRWRIPYSQARPSQLGPVSLISRADCSGSIAGGCHWASILPRVDWRWTNTDVQIHFGVAVGSVREALPGDVFLYGRGGDPSHEALYLGGGRVWSFGSYPVKLLAHDYRHDRVSIRRFVP